jgi:hypothetical protein
MKIAGLFSGEYPLGGGAFTFKVLTGEHLLEEERRQFPNALTLEFKGRNEK